MWLSQTQFHTVSGILRNFRLREIGFSAQSVGFSLQFGNWEAFVLKGIFLDLRKDLIEFVLSLVRELQFSNWLSWMPFGMLNWVLEGVEIYEEKEKDMQERKRGLRNWEEGGKKKWKWCLAKWRKMAGNYSGVGERGWRSCTTRPHQTLFPSPSCSLYLFSSSLTHILPSIKALIGSGNLSAFLNPEISFVWVQPQINPA